MRRVAVLLVLIAAGAFAAPAVAAPSEDQFAEVRARVAEAEGLVDDAVAAAQAGDRERAYDLARTAYLDHFELAEVPLRLRDPNLVLDLEFSFAELRNGIRDGAPLSEIRSSAAEIRSGLVDVDRTLADTGFAAPLLAFLFSFTILFREGVEVVLLLAILLGALSAGRASGYRKPLAGGVIAALLATAVTWVLATAVLEIAPVQRELLEGVTAVAAVAVLFVVSFWLVSRLDHKHWLEFMRARVAAAISAGSAVAFAGLGFTAVYREGFETVLFYQALAIFAEGLGIYVALGVVAAAAALGVVAYAVLKLGRRIPREAAADRGRVDPAAPLGHVRGQCRAVAAGCGLGLDHAGPGRLGAAAVLRRGADGHPPDPRRSHGPGRPPRRLLRRSRLGLRDPAAAARGRAGGAGVSTPLRIGVDVGGTFTKAVAVETAPLRLLAHTAVPTSHEAAGVAEGVVDALRALLDELGEDRRRVALVAFSTTQAMNALLEGDVGRVGVVGIGSQPDLRAARKRTRVGSVALAPGHALETEHAFLDVTGGIDDLDVNAALEALAAAGCASFAVSGALAVDEPGHELRVAGCAQALGLPACVGHDLTGAYGLEMRTVSAAVNASILPVVERTASLVEQALADAGLDVPLLVLRGDGGAMSIDAFRRRPSFTIGSGPAAGVAAALHQLGLADAIVVECGGTSSNVSIVKRGRPIVRSLRVMGRPTCVRAVDSWVVGAAGGSMARLKRSSIAQTGPRSAHIAGLPYACFADASALGGAELELVAPREGDPDAYACIRAGGTLFALTATCAANALGVVPDDAYSFAGREAALAAFGPLAERLKTTPAAAARRLLDGAVDQIVKAVEDAVRQHDLQPDVPLVALGGAGEALVPLVAERLKRPLVRPRHPEVLSSIGAAVSLVRAEVTRNGTGSGASVELARKRSARASRPARLRRPSPSRPPSTPATACCGRSRPGPSRSRSALPTANRSAARLACSRPPGRSASSRTSSSSSRRRATTRSTPRTAPAAWPPSTGAARLRSRRTRGESSRPAATTLVEELRREVEAATRNLGVATLLPRVSLVCGSQILDLSDARRPEEVALAAARTLAGHTGTAVAVVTR